MVALPQQAVSAGVHPASRDGAPSPQPGVSIVIPTYNYEQYLGAAIDSALAQTYPNLEVLIIDDGSTDGTAQLIGKYGSRVRYLAQPNAGLSAARNTGIREAAHEYLVFLDADDVLAPAMVERCMAQLQRLGPAFALIGCGEVPIDSRGEKIPRRGFLPLVDREITAADLVVMSRFPPSVLVRRNAFTECGLFEPALRSTEDRDMWIRIASRHRVYRLHEGLVLKRVHGANMSRHSRRQSATKREVISRAFAARAVPRWRVDYWLRVWAVYFFQSGLMYHDEGAPLTALRQLLSSILVCPWLSRPADLDQPALFRVRAIARVLLQRP